MGARSGVGSGSGSVVVTAMVLASTSTSTVVMVSGSGSAMGLEAGTSLWRGFCGRSAFALCLRFQGFLFAAALSAALGSSSLSRVESNSSLGMMVTKTRPFLKTVSFTKSGSAVISALISAQSKSTGVISSAINMASTVDKGVCMPHPSSSLRSLYR